MRTFSLVVVTVLVLTTSVYAGVVEYTNKTAWQNAVGSYNTIDFTGFQHGTPLTNQYQAAFGITFVGTNNIVHTSSFVNDGQGVRGQPGSRMYFDTPQKWIAVDYLGDIAFRLYYRGELVYASQEFFNFVSPFVGLVSDTPFDEVYLHRIMHPGLVFYDDLYFGVPAPGALGVFAIAALGCRRWRR